MERLTSPPHSIPRGPECEMPNVLLYMGGLLRDRMEDADHVCSNLAHEIIVMDYNIERTVDELNVRRGRFIMP